MEFVRVAQDVPAGTTLAVSVGRYDVALFNVDGTIYALENSCPHQGSPIVDGHVERFTVTCPWHAWCFDLRSGKMTLGDLALIPTFAVRQAEGGVYVSAEPTNQ